MPPRSLRSCCNKNKRDQPEKTTRPDATHLVGVEAMCPAQLKLAQRAIECTGVSVADANNVHLRTGATSTRKQHVQLPDAPVHIRASSMSAKNSTVNTWVDGHQERRWVQAVGG